MASLPRVRAPYHPFLILFIKFIQIFLFLSKDFVGSLVKSLVRFEAIMTTLNYIARDHRRIIWNRRLLFLVEKIVIIELHVEIIRLARLISNIFLYLLKLFVIILLFFQEFLFPLYGFQQMLNLLLGMLDIFKFCLLGLPPLNNSFI